MSSSYEAANAKLTEAQQEAQAVPFFEPAKLLARTPLEPVFEMLGRCIIQLQRYSDQSLDKSLEATRAIVKVSESVGQKVTDAVSDTSDNTHIRQAHGSLAKMSDKALDYGNQVTTFKGSLAETIDAIAAAATKVSERIQDQHTLMGSPGDTPENNNLLGVAGAAGEFIDHINDYKAGQAEA